VNLLLDENSFVELDLLVEHRCSNFGMDKIEAPGEGVITGYGTINGRLTYVFAQDFTVIGGSLGEMHAKKISKVMDMAMKWGHHVLVLMIPVELAFKKGVDSLSGYGAVILS